ncbi:MAG: beta-ketoacyl synthase N-terminal-like domain-containing protein, partial [Anaerolineaceae bacterium]
GLAVGWDALATAQPAGRDWSPDDEPGTFFAAPISEDYRPHDGIPRNLAHFMDRGTLVAVDAALQAIESAGLHAGAGDSRRFAVADGLPYRAPGQATLFVPYGHAVARVLGTRGPATSEGGVEASGLAAIATAARLIARNDADIVVAGGAQALQRPLLDHLRAQGFSGRSPAKPFDIAHAGMVPAEGAAYVVIEAEGHARARGAAILGRIAGVGQIFDSTAEPLATSDSAEAGRVMQAALGDAGYLQNQVDLHLASADGRSGVDYGEGYGAKRTFGRHAYYAAVSTIAGALGSALGASGALALAFAIESFQRQQVFPIAGFENPETDLDLAYVRSARPEKLDCILVTSLGLGGTNVGIVLSRE